MDKIRIIASQAGKQVVVSEVFNAETEVNVMERIERKVREFQHEFRVEKQAGEQVIVTPPVVDVITTDGKPFLPELNQLQGIYPDLM